MKYSKLAFIIICTFLASKSAISASIWDKTKKLVEENPGIIYPSLAIGAVALSAYPWRTSQITDLTKQKEEYEKELAELTAEATKVKISQDTFQEEYNKASTNQEKITAIQNFFINLKEPLSKLNKCYYCNKQKFTDLFSQIDTNTSALEQEQLANLEIDSLLQQNMNLFNMHISNNKLTEWIKNSSAKSYWERRLKEINEDLEYYQKKFSLKSHYWNWMMPWINTDYSMPFRFIGLGIAPFVLLYSLWEKFNQKK